MARLLLAGYFGAGNLGDDAILMGFVKGLEGTKHETRVVAGSPERLMRNLGLTGVPKLDMNAVKNAIGECDALVFPGGSIFQDVTSVRSVAYYAGMVKEAKKAGKKVIMLGQGVGPLNRFLGRRLAAQAFGSADVIAVRDPDSVNALKSLGTRVTPRVTADCAFLLPEPHMADNSTSFGVAGMKTVGLSARPWGRDKNKTVVKVFGDLVKMMSENGFVPVMVPMDETEDTAIVNAISKVHGGKVPELKGITTPVQLQQRLARMESVIAMRLHAGILAASVGVPPYMVAYDPKVTAFANVLGYSAPPSMQGITAERIFNGFQTFIKDRDRAAEALVRKREELRKAAMGNIDLLRSALGE